MTIDELVALTDKMANDVPDMMIDEQLAHPDEDIPTAMSNVTGQQARYFMSLFHQKAYPKENMWLVCLLHSGGNEGIAKKSDVSLSTVSHIHANGCSLETAGKIAAACGFTMEQLWEIRG
ncbi:hypothetical protein ACFQ5J_12285 [Lacticaseibacillus baoqingensis]|uniref:Uncharacterized protein n=1 Tax=Lacticaseibacillus baoqingensis TaxID=2486013 RepID=A0ABW4EA57_9LACO|nr:hypothetical protein [Lacticaseibacillus baoqingensis]